MANKTKSLSSRSSKAERAMTVQCEVMSQDSTGAVGGRAQLGTTLLEERFSREIMPKLIPEE